ncbi:MAG: hypothetical protein NWE77_06655 [Candidatus Bathyarchaeota archaeon]|jgi:hypothetical protein|nr:hypothetical protein [Candidatus Bathyarchaeota archaeon]
MKRTSPMSMGKGGKNKKKPLDACARKVKSRYKIWPSAYASGAVAKCRKVGVKNWGRGSKKN